MRITLPVYIFAIVLSGLIISPVFADKIPVFHMDSQTLRESVTDQGSLRSLSDHLLTFSHKAALDLTGEEINPWRMDQQIEAMADEIRSQLQPSAGTEETFRQLNRWFFRDKNFQVDRSRLYQSPLESLLLSEVIKKRRGHCLSLSLLYLMLAEKLALPVRGVIVPGHFFVRYDDGNQRLNVETTDQGRHFSDHYYLKRFMHGVNDSISLRDLDKPQVLAVYISNLANHYKLRGWNAKAIEIFHFVLDVLPGSPGVYINLGNAYERSGRIVKAIVQYQHALKINPYLCQAHYNLALIHFLYTKMFPVARQHGKTARQLGCHLHPRFGAFLQASQP